MDKQAQDKLWNDLSGESKKRVIKHYEEISSSTNE